MNTYKPTWLYVKQHNQTGLKYFGKTSRPDPVTYYGSGKYWQNHLKKHGYDVTTLWCQLFHSKDELVRYANEFSNIHQITESKEWANLKPETGVDGGCAFQSIETRDKISKARLGIPMSDEAKKKSSIRKKGIPRPSEVIEKLRASKIGKKLSDEHRTKISEGKMGHVVTLETRKKLSLANSGKQHGSPSDETRKKQSISMRGKNSGPKSEQHKANLSMSRKGKPWSQARRDSQNNRK